MGLIDLSLMPIGLTNLLAGIIAALITLIDPVPENRHWVTKIVTALFAFSIAGTVIDYIPNDHIFSAILVGVISGIFTDDLYFKLTKRMPEELDKLLDLVFQGIRKFFKKWFNIGDE